MTLVEYSKFVLKLEAPYIGMDEDDYECRQTWRIDHCMRGIFSECGEVEDALKKHINYGLPLNQQNVLEELGDLLFYGTLLANVIRADLQQIDDKFFDHQKSSVYRPAVHQHTIKHDIGDVDVYMLEDNIVWIIRQFFQPDSFLSENGIHTIFHCLSQCCLAAKVSMNEILALNVAKLSKRYKDKFTQEECVNRDTKEEMRSFDEFVQPADY